MRDLSPILVAVTINASVCCAGYDPVAMLRWSIVRVFFRCFFAFIDAGKRYRKRDQGQYIDAGKRYRKRDQGQYIDAGKRYRKRDQGQYIDAGKAVIIRSFPPRLYYAV